MIYKTGFLLEGEQGGIPLNDFCLPLKCCCPSKISKHSKRRNNKDNSLLLKTMTYCPHLKKEHFSSRKPEDSMYMYSHHWQSLSVTTGNLYQCLGDQSFHSLYPGILHGHLVMSICHHDFASTMQ